MSWRAWVMLWVVVAAAGLGAGCQQRETPEQYEKKVAASLEQRTRYITGIPPNADEDYYLSAKQAFQRDVQTLREVSPPAAVQQAHDAYLRSLRGSITLLQRLADCSVLAEADAARGRECVRRISTDELDRIENDYREAIAIFTAEGYRIIEDAAEQPQTTTADNATQ